MLYTGNSQGLQNDQQTCMKIFNLDHLHGNTNKTKEDLPPHQPLVRWKTTKILPCENFGKTGAFITASGVQMAESFDNVIGHHLFKTKMCLSLGPAIPLSGFFRTSTRND